MKNEGRNCWRFVFKMLEGKGWVGPVWNAHRIVKKQHSSTVQPPVLEPEKETVVCNLHCEVLIFGILVWSLLLLYHNYWTAGTRS